MVFDTRCPIRELGEHTDAGGVTLAEHYQVELGRTDADPGDVGCRGVIARGVAAFDNRPVVRTGIPEAPVLRLADAQPKSPRPQRHLRVLAPAPHPPEDLVDTDPLADGQAAQVRLHGIGMSE